MSETTRKQPQEGRFDSDTLRQNRVGTIQSRSMRALVNLRTRNYPDARECLAVLQGPNIYIGTHITEVGITRDIDRFAHVYGYEKNYNN
jgi:hypothetical protein